MSAIRDKIAKLLALGERGGTEAEAEAAMRHAHVLLAKHNLSLDEVKGHGQDEEVIEIDDSTPSVLRNSQWRDMIYHAMAEMYFCDIFFRVKRGANRSRSIAITGRPSNITVVKYMAEYLVRTGDELAAAGAKEAAQRIARDGIELNVRAWSGSFRLGYASRILTRARKEVAEAKAGGLHDDVTGTALVVAPLYDREANAIALHIRENVGKLKSAAQRQTTVRSSSGYQAGSVAGEQASLRTNAVGASSAGRIGFGG